MHHPSLARSTHCSSHHTQHAHSTAPLCTRLLLLSSLPFPSPSLSRSACSPPIVSPSLMCWLPIGLSLLPPFLPPLLSLLSSPLRCLCAIVRCMDVCVRHHARTNGQRSCSSSHSPPSRSRAAAQHTLSSHRPFTSHLRTLLFTRGWRGALMSKGHIHRKQQTLLL